MPATTQPPLLETADALLTPGEVARLFRVDPKTVARWDKEGKLSSVKTLGGHRRYPQEQLNSLLQGTPASGDVLTLLENAHTLALDTGSHLAVARISALLDELRTQEP